MNSSDLKQVGFGWYSWKKLTVLDVPYKKSGVYAFKSMVPEQRKKGSSDVVYIGSTDNLVRRIFANYIGGVGGSKPSSTTQRIHKKLFDEGYLNKTEIGWVTSENFDKLEKYLEGTINYPAAAKHKELEKRLKLKFEKEHGEYPLWNKVL